MDLQMSSLIIILTFLVTLLIRPSESELRNLNSEIGSVAALNRNFTKGPIHNDLHMNDEIKVTKFEQYHFEDGNSVTENEETKDLNGASCDEDMKNCKKFLRLRSKSKSRFFENVKSMKLQNDGMDKGVVVFAKRSKRELRLKTTILSPRLTTVQRGSILNLLCVVSEHDRAPDRIAWVINGTVLDFQYHRGGVHLELIRQKKSTTSKLTINDFHQEDAGMYECRAEGYPDPIKNLIMEPSYRDAVEVRVVEHVKKEMFSHGQRWPIVTDNLTFLSAIAILIWTKLFFT